eukprot:Amastigsp_a339505_54.p4 type:complete len:145 gc:universal Amastigsp_a339505_54:1130-696(-)
MTAAAPPLVASDDADSMRSGRRVPCARITFAGSSPRAASVASVTRMNVSPMILRFSSGATASQSGTVARPSTVVVACANVSAALATISSTPRASSARITCADSSLRMNPESTWSPSTRAGPSASASRAAHTVESTPPLTSTRTV